LYCVAVPATAKQKEDFMSETVDISVDFAGLKLANPVFTASGTSGYADELADFMDISRLGGFITKSITLKPRKGNTTPRIVETDSGMLNAIGLANIGLDAFVEEKIPVLEQFSAAVFVNVAGETIGEYVAVVQQLASEKAIAGFELNISCPNVAKGGITFGTDPSQVSQITSAVKKAVGEKILIVKLTPTVTDISVIANAAVEAGADALSMVNTFTAMVIDIETRKPVLANRTGGLSGPAIKPIAVYLVNKVYNEVAKESGIPILGIGGIRNASDAIEFIIAGASAVAVGTANFIEPDCTIEIIEGIKKYCVRNKIVNMEELIGSLEI
jgi:dihydroorotate dehydrogenase (NAD+) catalytic subunit